MKVIMKSMNCARVRTAMAVLLLWGLGLAWSPLRAVGQCCGDCDGDGAVTVDEIITGVNGALGSCKDDGICSLESCAARLATCRDDLATSQCDVGAVPTAEQDRVREVVSSFYTAFSSNTFDTWAPDFTTEDWSNINVHGGWTRGRENVLAEFRQVLSTFLSGVTDTVEDMSVRFVTCDVAVVTATSLVSPHTTPDGVEHVNELHRRTFVAVKHSDRWLITQEQNTLIG